MAATVEALKPYIDEFDPRELLAANDVNVRTDLGDLEELAASIADDEVGMVEFPVLTPRADDTMRVVAGFRRLTAAVEAGKGVVYCVVRPEWADKPMAVLIAMIKENTQRKALSVKEEADAWAQLMLFEGMTVEKAAKQTGRKKDYISGQLALAKVKDDTAVSLANEGRLSPEIAAALNEFEGQPRVQARILRKVGEYTNTGRWGGEHIAEEERRKRDAKQTAAQRIQELRAAGATILRKKPKDFCYSSREADVTSLRDAKGNKLDGDKLVFKPGFAALLDSNQGYPKVRIVCLDPESHGYVRRSGDQFVSDQERARQAKAEREAEAIAEAIEAAQATRRKFLVETYGNTKSKAAKAALAGALRQAAHRPDALSPWRSDELIIAIAGTDPATVTATTSAERVNRILIARYVALQENALASALKIGRVDEAAAAWLDRLVALGYDLSPVETARRAKLLGQEIPVVQARATADDLSKPCTPCGADSDEECDESCDLLADDAQPSDNVQAGEAQPSVTAEQRTETGPAADIAAATSPETVDQLDQPDDLPHAA